MNAPSNDFSPQLFASSGRLLDRFTRRYFRFALRGTERMPDEPCLIVGNHSALGFVDVLTIQAGWYRHFGLRRRANAMMHDFYISLPLVGRFYRNVGALPASRANAHAALDAGHDVLCYPGGDYDSGRPFHAAREVRFNERRGYARLALERGVPIVPLATIGSQHSYTMLPGGVALARTFDLHRRLRTHCLPLPLGPLVALLAVVAALAGWLGWPIAMATLLLGLIPWPVRVTSELLEPIDVCAATAHLDDMDARVELGHRIVHERLSRAVATMAHDLPAPSEAQLTA